MAIVILNGEIYQRAKEIAGDDQAKLIAEYKKIGGPYIEGTNEVVGPQPGFIRFMDEPKKKSKKLGAVKKSKKGKK